MATMVDKVADRVNDSLDGVGRWVDSKPAGLMNRLIGLSLAAPSWTVIGLSRWLVPSEKGYGTHLQLGLGECTMMHLTGYPCPMCGMTTTFALYAHLRVFDALLNQPFGVVMFGGTLAAAAIGFADLVSGRGYWRSALRAVERREQVVSAVLLGGMLLGWVYKIFMIHPELIPGR